MDTDSILRFKCRTANGEEITATRESLRTPESPDIGWISANVPEMKQASTHLKDEDIAKLSNPV